MTHEKRAHRRQKVRNLSQRKRLKKYRQRILLVFYILMLILFCGCFWRMGKAAGKKEYREELSFILPEEENVIAEGTVMEGLTEPDAEREEFPILVNRNNPLPEDYQAELVTLADGVNRAAREAYQPLCDMLSAGRKEGLTFEICSSYRDVERQGELFWEDLNALMNLGYSYVDAYREVAKETMPPGYSEHSTGLAFDIVAFDYQMLDDGQERTAENKWLREHCAEYGFILRYPEGKEDITFINYESWHFRYVGREAAEYIMENGITLEEYLNLFE